MNPFYRTASLTAVFALLFISSFAGKGFYAPVRHNFIAAAKKVDSVMSAEVVVSHKSAKVCSCQILSVESKNYQQSRVVVFAEKTNKGDLKADYAAARKRIEKEKKHMKDLFYDKVDKTYEVNGAMDCHALYVQLKSAVNHLRMYDILDADLIQH